MRGDLFWRGRKVGGVGREWHWSPYPLISTYAPVEEADANVSGVSEGNVSGVSQAMGLIIRDVYHS